EQHDTSQVPVVDTGQVPAVPLGVPRGLKVLVGVVAFLIVVGGLALVEHDHVKGWAHDVRSNTVHWFDNAKVAVGIDASPKTHNASSPPASRPTEKPAGSVYKVAVDPSGRAATFNVAAASFVVRITAVNA